MSTSPPLISQNCGAGHVRRVAAACRTAIRFVLVRQLLICGVLAMAAPLIAEMRLREKAA